MISDTNTFASLSEMVEHFSTLPGVVGIVEYGGRTHTNMLPGGDYDLTVIFEKPVSSNFSGIHFHVRGIPVDCMLLSVEDFAPPQPWDFFHLVHLNVKVLYDKDGITQGILDDIQVKWKKPSHISENQVMSFRFATRHTLDKLEHSLFDDEVYSHYMIADTASMIINFYADTKGLEPGKPRVHLSYMAENDPALYSLFEKLYKTTDLSIKFAVITEINTCFANNFGGMWKRDEALFHISPSGKNNENEQLSFIKFLF